jgi:ADP-ribose pyrophosphatase YjhB (NUDIX family)
MNAPLVTPAPDWLKWGRQVQAVAQTGLTYTENPFDRERYKKLEALAVEMFAAHTGQTPARLAEWFAVQPGYATPKVDVRAACFRDGKLLMVRERSDGGWCLPGGWADVGDQPAAAAEREVREEAGFTCAARKVIGVFDANRGAGQPLAAFHAYKLIFACELTDGAPQPDHEILEVAFFERDGLPALSASRTTPSQLEECFAHLDDPARPTAFD